MAELADFWNGIPPVTKAFLVPSAVVPFILRFNPNAAGYFLYSVEFIFKRGQLFRLITPFFYRELGFSFLLNIFFLYRHMKQLEEEEFRGRRGDFVWMLILLMVGILVFGAIGRRPILSEALMLAILYVWSRKFPDVNMTFMFGLRFKSQYLVWVLTIYHFILGGSIMHGVIGIICGHLYWFCSDVLPRTHNIRLVDAPILLQRLIPNTGVAGVQHMNGQFEAHAPENPLRRNGQPEPNVYRRHNWGGGHRLGDE